MGVSIPAYLKYVLNFCGFDNALNISTIEEKDFTYFEQQVKNGNVTKFYKRKLGKNVIFEGCTSKPKKFKFSEGHKILLLKIIEFTKSGFESGSNSRIQILERQGHEKSSQADETVAAFHENDVSIQNKMNVNSNSGSSFHSLSQCEVQVGCETVQVGCESVPKKFKLLQIECNSHNTKNYYDEKGYVYTRNNSKTSKSLHFRCKNSTLFSCKARVTVKNNDFEATTLTVSHNHPAEKKILDKVIFDKKLDETIRKMPFVSPRKAYLRTKVILKDQVDRKNIPSLMQYETFIHRRQKLNIPLKPTTIADFESLMNDPKYKQYYCLDERKMPFYRGVWKTVEGASNIIFISERVLQFIKTMEEITLLMDGTFKVLPYHLKFRQLYIISVVFNNRSYPLAFILTEKKDYHTYDSIFANIKSMIPSINVTHCMTDYELATRKALKKHFPTARISGCFFHYVQAIVKATKRFGLRKLEKFNQAVQEVCALALLPNEFILSGFEMIDKQFKDEKQWNKFKKYWLKQWLRANISVYGLINRTNNFAESLNKSLNLLIQRKHPNIWILIANIKLLEMERSDELEKHSAGDMKLTRKSKLMMLLNDKITKATQMFRESEDVGAFLKNVTFNEKLELYFKERIAIENVDEDDEFDDDEGDELIIPNDFNIESNFRLEHPRAATIKRKVSTKGSNKKQKNK